MALLEKDYEKRKPLTKILELIPSDKKTPAKKEKKKSIIQNEENVLKNNEPQPKEIRSQFPSFELKIKEDKSKIAQNSFINVLEIANEEAPLPRNNKNSLDLKKEDEKKKENGKKEIENKTKEITEKQIYEPNSESEKINQKFKIRPCSANVMMNKIKENKESLFFTIY